MNERDIRISANLLKIASVAFGLLLWHVLAVYVINDTALLVSPMAWVSEPILATRVSLPWGG